MEPKELIISLIVVSILISSLLGFSQSIVSQGNQDASDEFAEMLGYNKLDEMNKASSTYVEKLEGNNGEFGIKDFFSLLVFGSWDILKSTLKQIPILSALIIGTGKIIGIPEDILVGLISIVAIGIVFWIARLLISVGGILK